MSDEPKIDQDQLSQIIKALYEVMRSESGYGRIEIRVDKGRPMFITKSFDDRLLPRRLKDETYGD